MLRVQLKKMVKKKKKGNGEWRRRRRKNSTIWAEKTGKMLRKWTKSNLSYLEKINKIDTPLARLMRANKKFLKKGKQPWLVWLSGLSASRRTKRSPVRFPLRTHAWVVGQTPSWRCVGGNQSMYFSHIDVSLSLFLPLFPSLWK